MLNFIHGSVDMRMQCVLIMLLNAEFSRVLRFRQLHYSPVLFYSYTMI